MSSSLPLTMNAAVLDHFGGPEALALRALPIPDLGPGEVMIRVEVAGVGSWDAEERAGGYASYLGEPRFPYVLGWDGAGTVAAVGEGVDHVRIGDRVYAAVTPRPSGGGFYAEYAVAEAGYVALVPESLSVHEAGAMGWDAQTALSGLTAGLGLKAGETVLIFGASGGIGHMAVQLAARMGARVFAVASGTDGVALAERLGADAAVDGRRDDIVGAARAFAPGGLDAALLTAGGEAAERALTAVRDGGRAAYPNGVHPKPVGRVAVAPQGYDGARGPEASADLHRWIARGPFEVHVARTFALDEIVEAHHMLARHHLGKLAVRPGSRSERS